MAFIAKRSLKKPTNVSIRADLLAEAKALGLNLSRTLESALEQAIREKYRQKWLEDNRNTFHAYDRHIERDGLFADGLRQY